jgi:1-acyl-sn-glycerol-3-phosphate acyltransferase
MATSSSAPSIRTRLLKAIERPARSLGSGLLFVFFGFASLALAIVVIPLVVWIQGAEDGTDLTAQRLIHRTFRLFTRVAIGSGMFGATYVGMERLSRGPCLVVANHSSLLDIVFLISFMPQGDCVVKSEAWSNPALRGIVSSAGYIPNDGGESLIEACVSRLRAGRSVVLFPEGTRSPEVGLGRFRRGAAHIALRSGCPMVPIRIVCDPPAFLKKGQPWYAVPNERMKYVFAAGAPVYAKDLVSGDLTQSVAARRVTAWLRSYFESEQVASSS